MMSEQKKIILTGGGTTGHVAVNLALIPRLLEKGWEIHYIGSEKGIERDLIADFDEVTYHAIATGKLRRYLSKDNILDVGRVIKGVGQARKLIRKIKPNVIFSKGGYVSVPVVIGGHFNGVPSISHESDLTPGLANKLSMPFVKKVMLTFQDSLNHVKESKAFYLGPVIREQIKDGDGARARKEYGFSGDKPVMLVMGGSLGAASLNRAIWENLDSLLEKYDILHGVGQGKGDPTIERPGYVQEEYIRAGMNDALAMADIIISRAGSNAIFEFLYYHKPMLLVPLGTNQSRGDQILNAEQFEKRGYAKVLFEEDVTPESFIASVQDIEDNKQGMIAAQETFEFHDAVGTIIEELDKIAK